MLWRGVESELSFAYVLSIVDADSLAAMLEAERDRARSEPFTRLASGSHVPVIEFAHVGFVNEDDLLEHEELLWLAHGTDAQAEAESSARRILDEFLRTLRQEGTARAYLEDVWPHAQIRMDPEVKARLHDHAAPPPDYLRILL